MGSALFNQIITNMKKNTLESLAELYKVDDFTIYICDTWLEEKKALALQLFYMMQPKDRADFMNELNYCTFEKDGPWQMDFLHDIIYSLYHKGWL